ncbi:MAG: hypothetical protein QNJ91_01465, partial [Gammaproteobacteria bacterium]|nr:hypothetical protein [Gammaproteobacteria bacterium]
SGMSVIGVRDRGDVADHCRLSGCRQPHGSEGKRRVADRAFSHTMAARERVIAAAYAAAHAPPVRRVSIGIAGVAIPVATPAMAGVGASRWARDTPTVVRHGCQAA